MLPANCHRHSSVDLVPCWGLSSVLCPGSFRPRALAPASAVGFTRKVGSRLQSAKMDIGLQPATACRTTPALDHVAHTRRCFGRAVINLQRLSSASPPLSDP